MADGGEAPATAMSEITGRPLPPPRLLMTIRVFKEGHPERKLDFRITTKTRWLELIAKVEKAFGLEAVDGLYDVADKGMPVERIATLSDGGLYFARPTKPCALLRSLVNEKNDELFPAWELVERGRRAKIDLSSNRSDYGTWGPVREGTHVELVPAVPDASVTELVERFCRVANLRLDGGGGVDGKDDKGEIPADAAMVGGSATFDEPERWQASRDPNWTLRTRILRKLSNALLRASGATTEPEDPSLPAPSLQQLQKSGITPDLFEMSVKVIKHAFEEGKFNNLALQYSCWCVSSLTAGRQKAVYSAGVLPMLVELLREHATLLAERNTELDVQPGPEYPGATPTIVSLSLEKERILKDKEKYDPIPHLLASIYAIIEGFPLARVASRDLGLHTLCIAILKEQADDFRTTIYSCWVMYELMVAQPRPMRRLKFDDGAAWRTMTSSNMFTQTAASAGGPAAVNSPALSRVTAEEPDAGSADGSVLDLIDGGSGEDGEVPNAHASPSSPVSIANLEPQRGGDSDSVGGHSLMTDDHPIVQREREQLMELYRSEVLPQAFLAAEKARTRAYNSKKPRVAAQVLSYGMHDMENKLLGQEAPRRRFPIGSPDAAAAAPPPGEVVEEASAGADPLPPSPRTDVAFALDELVAAGVPEDAVSAASEQDAAAKEIAKMMDTFYYKAFHTTEGERMLSYSQRVQPYVREGRAKGAM
mmetsp:Transcript_20287/g.61617  ORF Transcript_20287/g.61617 Transcript_20287/m.61617 type:complete len:708 (-) Transcript_20287:108-2231(-)